MKGKLALITGASRGLGRSAALHLAAQGVDIIGTYLSQSDDAQAVAEEIKRLGARALMLQLDVGDSASFAAFVERVRNVLTQDFGRQNLDFLVNNGRHRSTRQLCRNYRRAVRPVDEYPSERAVFPDPDTAASDCR